MSYKVLSAAGIAAIIVATLAGLIFLTDRPYLQGSVIDPPLPGAEIGLNETNGRPFVLEDQRGKVTLISFGYTNCPDECPLTMANLKLAVEMLGSDADRTTVVLVTTDPERDTPDVLRTFLDRFNTGFMGLTGPAEDLARVWKAYGVTVMDGGETHSNYVYVIDKSGNLVETILADAGAAAIAEDIRTLLSED